jgi:hypothetical protein
MLCLGHCRAATDGDAMWNWPIRRLPNERLAYTPKQSSYGDVSEQLLALHSCVCRAACFSDVSHAT